MHLQTIVLASLTLATTVHSTDCHGMLRMACRFIHPKPKSWLFSKRESFVLGSARRPKLTRHDLGSSFCGMAYGNVITEINNQIDKLPDGNIYEQGQNLASSGHIKAFLEEGQRTRTGREIKSYMQDLINFGCRKCGSTASGPNGRFKINYIHD